jgi:hypothetical protein
VPLKARVWLGLQTDYDLDVAVDELGDRIEHEVTTNAETI